MSSLHQKLQNFTSPLSAEEIFPRSPQSLWPCFFEIFGQQSSPKGHLLWCLLPNTHSLFQMFYYTLFLIIKYTKLILRLSVLEWAPRGTKTFVYHRVWKQLLWMKRESIFALEQWFSTCEPKPLWVSHSRYPQHQIFTFSTVSNYRYKVAVE